MPVECLDSRQEFAIVATRDENLSVRTDGGLEDGERPGCELVLLEQSNLVFSVDRKTSFSITDLSGSSARADDGQHLEYSTNEIWTYVRSERALFRRSLY